MVNEKAKSPRGDRGRRPRRDEKLCSRMRRHGVLLKAKGLSSDSAGLQMAMSHVGINA